MLEFGPSFGFIVTRGGGKPGTMVGTMSSGSGYISRSAEDSWFIHGSKAPSILKWDQQEKPAARNCTGQHQPEMMLIVTLSSMAYLRCTQANQSARQLLRRPTKLLVRRVTQSENGEMQVLKNIVGQVGPKKHVPKHGHWPGFLPRACRRNDEYYEGFVDEVRLHVPVI